MDGWMWDLFVLDGEVDRLGEVGVVHRRQDHGKNVRVHLRLVLRAKVLVTEQTLHPVQCHKDNGSRTCPHDCKSNAYHCCRSAGISGFLCFECRLTIVGAGESLQVHVQRLSLGRKGDAALFLTLWVDGM